ncbi:MAG: hypothetical protein ACI8RD_008598, partial [Bacillariaceae sp.]|jgi:hypothetical protein
VLDVLQNMISTTMMRGAQTGGVVIFANSKSKPPIWKGICSHVVNGKRTDLSVLLQKKIEKDICSLNKMYLATLML